MLPLVFAFALLRADCPPAHQYALRAVTLAKGWYLGRQVKQGLTSKQVLAILGVPRFAGAMLPLSGCQVGSKGLWIYPDYGVRVHWFTATEMWWAVPSVFLDGYRNQCPCTPETARVTHVEFDPTGSKREPFIPQFN